VRLLFVFTPQACERKKEENQNCVQDPRDVSRSCESFDGSALAGCWLRAVGCLGGDIVVLSLSRSPPPPLSLPSAPQTTTAASAATSLPVSPPPFSCFLFVSLSINPPLVWIVAPVVIPTGGAPSASAKSN